MQDAKREQFPQDLWKSQEDEQMDIATEAVRAKARKYERKSVLGHRLMWGLGPLLIALCLYRLFELIRLDKYVLAATMTWLLATSCYVIGGFLRNSPKRMGAAEPCGQFLKREFEGKLQFVRATRLWILLLLPAVLVAWWAGGPALTAKGLGIKSDWLLQVHAPLPLILTLAVLAFIWFAIGNVAKKARQEIEKLRSN